MELYNKTQLPIVLVPIGLALRHEDDIACERLKSCLSIPSCVLNSRTIYDIMYAIANSKLFIGTSLHGNITAMSYDVPNVGFGGQKLDGYLKKWAWGLQKVGCITPDIISRFAIKVLEQNPDDYKEANLHRRELARENLENIMGVIKSSFCECK